MTYTYQNSASYQTGDANYQGGKKRVWYGKITDTNGANYMPTFSTPKVLSVSESHDKNLIFALSCGADVSRAIDPRTGLPDSSKYNMRALGAGIHSGTTTLNKPIEISGLAYGVVTDPDFIEGKCVKFLAQTGLSFANGPTQFTVKMG